MRELLAQVTIMSDRFHAAVDIIIEQEGDYVCDPEDPGGETRWGICKRSYPSLDIKHLTRDEAVAIYHRDYWQPLRLDELPPALALAVFDSAVLEGRKPAVRMLQSVLGESLDGIVGLRTITAARRAPLPDTLHRFMGCRAVYDSNLGNFGRFGRGWMTRLFSVHQACLELMGDRHRGRKGALSA